MKNPTMRLMLWRIADQYANTMLAVMPYYSAIDIYHSRDLWLASMERLRKLSLEAQHN